MGPLRLHLPLRWVGSPLSNERYFFVLEHVHPGGNVFGHFFMHNPVSRLVHFFIFTTPPLRHPFRNTCLINGQGSLSFDHRSVFFIAWRTCQSNAALLQAYCYYYYHMDFQDILSIKLSDSFLLCVISLILLNVGHSFIKQTLQCDQK